MKSAAISEVQQGTYELAINIDASPETVWQTLLEETNRWWLSDFRMVAPDSEVIFDLNAGGQGLVEQKSGGGFLQWYQVQAHLPEQRKLYLVGHISADFGGPATSHLCLSVEEEVDGTRFRITDSLVGNVSEQSMDSLRSGWQLLFESGLAKYVSEN